MNDTESFSPEEQRVLDECLAVIKNGPAVAEVIGPAIDRIQSDRLDRAVANIETLLAISTNMEPEDGLRLWEEWKLTAPGRSGKADLKHRERVSQVVGQAASPPVVLTAVISECLASPEPTPDRKKEDTANRADRSENVCPIGHRCPDQLLKAASPKKSALPTSSSSCRESPPKTKPTANTGPQDALSASAPNTPNQVPAKLDEGTPDAEATTSAPFVLEAAAAADSTVQKQEQVSGMALQQVATNKSEVEIVYGPLKGTYRVHPCGALYPAMEGQPYIDLKKSVQRFGQRESIVLDGDVLLDGKNRLRVMNELGREPSVVQFRKLQTGMTPDQFIEGKNHRRNISEDQRLMILAKISAWRKEEALRRRASVACCSRSDSGSAGPENKPGAASNDEYRQEPADIPKAGRGRPKREAE